MRAMTPVFVALFTSLAFAQSTSVRVSDASPRNVRSTLRAGGPQALYGPSVCNDVARAWAGQPLAGGGTLSPNAFMNSASVSNGRVAFIADVAGSTRNQGVFFADAAGVHPIALGSGGGGGSGVPGPAVGDPSPLGGRFTGFFQGTCFVPALNANGDVLFMADVSGGSATRGLFLYRAATQAIVKVAALGDASPAGGTLVEIGPGTLNDAGTVVFLANGQPSADGQYLRWTNGVLSVVAEVGDLAPSGSAYVYLGRESFGFVDGTTIPVGPVPDINSAGAIAFGAITYAERGFVLQPPTGAAQWYVRDSDVTPIGGNYLDFWGANLNDSGQIAFMCDIVLGPGSYSGGWIVGKPGAWRKALAFYDLVEGTPVNVLAASRNPQSPLADNGDLLAWCDAARECEVLCRANGTQEVVAGAGDATSLGGVIGFFDSWPSMDALGELTMSCTTPGATNGASSAHFVLTLCTSVSTYCTAGTTQIGCVPSISGTGTPSASAASGFTIATDHVPGQTNGIVFYGVGGRVAVPWSAASTSFLCVKLPMERTPLQDSGGTLGVCDGDYALDFNAFRATHPSALGQPMTPGLVIDAQAWFRDPGAARNTNLSDALEFALQP